MALDEAAVRERAEILAKLLVLEERWENMELEIRELAVLIEGPPRSDSLRGRLHKLENDHAAAEAATAAVRALEMANEQRDRSDTRWNLSWKLRILLAIGSLIIVVCAVISCVVALRGGK